MEAIVMMIRLLIFTFIFLTEISVFADSSFPAHQGESPWSFTVIDEPSDTFVVNDTASATIDQELFSKDGSIYIYVSIRRYVGKTDANGYLLNVTDLVANGIVSETASIIIPAFDIDDEPFINDFYDCDGDGKIDEGLQHEVDEVFLNDEKIGILTGDSSRWQLNTFTVDIAKIKFPSAPGETAINRFRVDIDTANWDVVLSSGAVGCGTGWSTAIDWVGVKYEAASPVILVHGIRSDGAAFVNFQAGLDNRYVASDASINLIDVAKPNPIPQGCPNIPYTNSISHNIEQLRSLDPSDPPSIASIAKLYGTDSVHLVTHSKGGLDSRGFISSLDGKPIEIPLGFMDGVDVKHDLEVLSLITLNTPHQGSVLAAYGVEARQLTLIQARQEGPATLLPAKAYEGAYYCDLTPARASEFIASTKLPDGLQTASVATDADLDGDQEITDPFGGPDESAGYPPLPLVSNYFANLLYQLTGRVTDVTVTVSADDKITIDPTFTSSFQLNDTIVTKKSAGLYQTYPIEGWNHLNVHSTENAEIIATDAQQESGAGMVNWRLR